MSVNSTNMQNNAKKSNLAGELGMSLGMSAVMTGGFGSLSALRRNGFSPKKALQQAKLDGKTIEEFLKNSNIQADGFTKSYVAAKNYESLVSARKNLAKYTKKSAKKSHVFSTLIEKIKHPLTPWETLKGNVDNKIATRLKDAKEALEGSDSLITKLEKGVDISDLKDAKSLTFKKNAGNLFKEEIKNPLNLLFVAMSAYDRFKNEALPAFKNEGFVAGMKKTGKVIAKTAADTVSNAGFSAVFRLVGSRIGMVFGPMGASVGGLLGDIIGSFASNKLIVKIFGEDKTANEQTPQETQQTQETAQTAQNTQQKTAQGQGQNTSNNLLYQAHNRALSQGRMLSKEEVEKLAYAQAFPKHSPKVSYYS